MPEARLKIYSDLFEEVIERDRVFGTLLRKIKTAYDMLLLRSPEQEFEHPDVIKGQSAPGRLIQRYGGPDAYAQDAQTPDGRSNEPTTRTEQNADAWEMHRENRVLKDLVERLHLELEEAVKREHRWKQKVVKLKSRPGAHSSQANGQLPQQGVPGGYAPDGFAPYFPGAYPGHEDWANEYHQELSAELRGPHGHQMHQMPAHHGCRSFGAMRREPCLGDAGSLDPALHRHHHHPGGLLSMSSISPQNSMPYPQDCGMDDGDVTGADTESEDSGRLPQRPERRQVVRPVNVPRLDLTRIKPQVDLDEEEEEEAAEGDEVLETVDLEQEPMEDEEDDDEGLEVDAAMHYASEGYVSEDGAYTPPGAGTQGRTSDQAALMEQTHGRRERHARDEGTHGS